MGGLALGGLLARAGVQVTLLEAHPEWLGGWAHTFAVGDYLFTAGPRYLWNFGPGQIGRRFLDKCGLTERVPMVELDRQGFDHIYLGDEEPIHVPNGWPAYEALLTERFPSEAPGICRFFALCRRSFRVFEVIDELGLYLDPWPTLIGNCLRRRPSATAWVLWQRNFTLEQAFEACWLSPRLRAVLYGHGGLFLTPPPRLSFHAYAAGTLFYHRGCYYPANDMVGFVQALVDLIRGGRGTVLSGQRVVTAKATRAGIQSVRTQTGETFAADVVVVDFDPKTFLGLLDPPVVRSSVRLPRYQYSASVHSLYLGISDDFVLRPRFGNWNLWYHAATEPMPDLYESDPLGEPRYLYLNSPTLVKGRNNDSPPGHATVTAFTPCPPAASRMAGKSTTPALREKHAARVIELIDRRFAPGLKEKVAALCLRTPEDKEQLLGAPEGNVYGRSFEPREVWTKIPFKGVLPNLYFAGAYVSFPGIAQVIHGACRVYQELTGDRV
jgi:phytoene dehydrogenase-like protein